MKPFIVFIGFVMFFTRVTAQQTVTPVEDMMSKYLLLKESLVISDSVTASQQAKALSASIALLRIRKVSIGKLDSLQKIRTAAIELADAVYSTKNINKQRKSFAKLSETLWFWLQNQQQPGFALFRQQCPMTGETWLSGQSEIKNPYYPKNMLTCGEVISEIPGKK